ncbi:DDB1- and CUL4-associated factor 1-like isoform X2 [Gouania willdenowi]|uniref:DDB1- and CUL4-associated factor 1-like isoform X2 n=1 Tax=Gouania willdenowi TaxID=441366 RepID=UPI001054A4CB|nr:DDB1- and CUL4-associated factor 1-like isoform X2 [Gouania willdenowi]
MTIDVKAELTALLEEWEEAQHGTTESQVSVLTRMSVLFEREKEVYHRGDPDPFDGRHQGYPDPDCAPEQLLKTIFKKADLTNTIIDSYILSSRDHALNTAACRLAHNIIPGLEISAVFQESLIRKLYSWAGGADPPLSVYATGLLGHAMRMSEVAGHHRKDNAQLVPVLIQHLFQLQNQQTPTEEPAPAERLEMEPGRGLSEPSPSSFSWSEVSSMVIGSDYHLWPLSTAMEQRLLLQYLASLGEYQELLAVFMQVNARSLLMKYIDLRHTQDVQLILEALLFLSSLLVHKKFAADFISCGGVQALLRIPRPSMASTGVSLCLYYLAYNQDAMERVCALPDDVLSHTVSYALWLLESSHSTGVCHATMFFSVCFPFRAVLLLFDRQDGLRRLVNLISTSEILDQENMSVLSDDQIFSRRQMVKHTCMALRRYFEAHLAMKTQQVKHSQHSVDGSMAPQPPHYKASSYSREQITGMMEFLTEHGPANLNWEPVELFLKLGGVPLLLKLIFTVCDWKTFYARSDTVLYALDVLAVLSVSPIVQKLLADTVDMVDGNVVGMSIILGVAEGELLSDADTQKSALQVIINCVCGPERSVNTHHQHSSAPHVLAQLWQAVQNTNGIKVLLSLLSVTTPLTDADAIRSLACKALVGLSRSSNIKQIISKLPLFTRSNIQQLTKEPVLQDKRSEHERFCRLAAQLTEQVSGGRVASGSDVSLSRLQRVGVVNNSNISFPPKELLLLIRNHLLSKGLLESAATLGREAGLSAPCCGSTPPTPSTLSRTCRFTNTPSRATPPAHRQAAQPGRILFSRERQSPSCTTTKRLSALKQKSDHGAFVQTPAMKKQVERFLPTPPSLDSIVVEYLREQHARCPNPVTTCPPFSLFTPHRCPEPRPRRHASPNVSVRLDSRRAWPRGGGGGGGLDRQLIFSRFRPVSVFLEGDGDESSFTCCCFSPCERRLMMGTLDGKLKVYNIFSGDEEQTHNCHTSAVTHLQSSRDGNLLLTSSSWSEPLSVLWTLDHTLTSKMSFSDEHYVEFSKLSEDRVVSTKDHIAHIYDVQTCRRVRTLNEEREGNNYKRNRATFNSSDELVLNDGVLWDVRTHNAVHKFDKFNANISGVFHPNSLEVLINTEIWDLRTFHLLHTVPALDQCRLVFNSNATVIYGAMLQPDDEDESTEQQLKSPFGSSFRTFHASDYKAIATVDVKREIFDLCVDSKDFSVAVIENQDSVSLDTVCRLYEVGRHKLAEEGDEDEEDDEDQDSSDGDDDDDDDDLIDLDRLLGGLENEEQGDENGENDNAEEVASDRRGSDEDSSESWNHADEELDFLLGSY